jgi:hypothetical protein
MSAMVGRQHLKIILLLLLVSILLAGCARQSQQPGEIGAADIEMTLDIVPDPPVVGASDLVITLHDKDRSTINGASLQIKGDMSHAGMKPVLAESAESKNGVYTVPFQWTMGGDWFVTVTATLPDGRVVNRRFELTVAGGMADDMEHKK